MATRSLVTADSTAGYKESDQKCDQWRVRTRLALAGRPERDEEDEEE